MGKDLGPREAVSPFETLLEAYSPPVGGDPGVAFFPLLQDMARYNVVGVEPSSSSSSSFFSPGIVTVVVVAEAPVQ